MAKKLVVFLSCVLLILISMGTEGWAHHPTGGGALGKAGPIRTVPATTLEQNKWTFGLEVEYTDFEPLSDRKLTSGEDVHSMDSIFHSVLGISYGITDNLMIALRFPYEYVNNIKTAHHHEGEGEEHADEEEPAEVESLGDSKGIGDLTVALQYRFLRDTAKELESAFFLGLRVPTGRTDAKDSNGERFETEFQPGTGAWSPLAGISLTKRFDSLSLDANLQYTLVTEGSQDTNLGDIFNYNLALSYRVPGTKKVLWDLMLELNGEWKEKEETDGEQDKNSGGNAVFLSPGVRVSWNAVSAYGSLGLPIIQDLNGTQSDTRYRAIFGVAVGF